MDAKQIIQESLGIAVALILGLSIWYCVAKGYQYLAYAS